MRTRLLHRQQHGTCKILCPFFSGQQKPLLGGEQGLRVSAVGNDLKPALHTPGIRNTPYLHGIGRQRGGLKFRHVAHGYL